MSVVEVRDNELACEIAVANWFFDRTDVETSIGDYTGPMYFIFEAANRDGSTVGQRAAVAVEFR